MVFATLRTIIFFPFREKKNVQIYLFIQMYNTFYILFSSIYVINTEHKIICMKAGHNSRHDPVGKLEVGRV